MMWIFLLSLIAFGVGYFIYAKYLSRLIGVDRRNPVPSVENRDGVDFVPTNRFILFGHHFASIAGAGPILGPIIAIGMYGWGPTFLWVILGSIFFGAVHDFLSLVISVKNKGRSIFDISKDLLGGFSSLFMLIFVFLALVIVVAVFSAFTAATFVSEPRIVIPTFIILLSALILSLLIYKLRVNLILSTLLALTLVVLSIAISFIYNIGITLPFDKKTSTVIWILILLGYSLLASILPVNLILQPRDYMNSYILFAGILFGIVGILSFGTLNINTKVPFFEISEIARDPATGLLDPLWPILFITVACGAISGFHSLVASGTTSKQLANEEDAKFVGYGGMLTESLLAVIVVISVIFFLPFNELVNLIKEGKAILAFGKAFGGLTEGILSGWGLAFAILMINGFMLTTLDTATRISRFLLEEIWQSFTKAKMKKYISALVVISLSGYLALSEAYIAIWKLFGTANQLVAALALFVITVFLAKKSKNIIVTLIPAVFMALTTLGSLFFHFYKYAFASHNLHLLIIDAVLLLIALTAFAGITLSLRLTKEPK